MRPTSFSPVDKQRELIERKYLRGALYSILPVMGKEPPLLQSRAMGPTSKTAITQGYMCGQGPLCGGLYRSLNIYIYRYKKGRADDGGIPFA